MSPHRRLSPLAAAIQATTAVALPALASASSIRSRSKHRHTHLHKDHHASSSSDDSTEEHTHHEHPHLHAHAHAHANSHTHSHSHDDTQDSVDELRRRDDSSATVVTQVVQTVSVVQVIDAQGSIVTLSTAYTPSATQAEADLSAAGTTADSSDSTQTGNTAAATAAAAATNSGSTSTAALTSGTAALTSGAASVTAAGSAFANGTATAISVPLTTGPSTAATLTGNSTATHLFGNSTSSTFHSLFANRTHSSSASSSYSSSSYLSSSSASSSGYSSSLYSSATGSSSAYSGEATGGADGAGGAAGSGAATGSGAGAAPTSTTTDDGTSSSTPTSVLVGSVIGGLAGLAVLLVIALYLLKMKKKKDQSSHRLLTDGDDSGAAGAAGTARSIPSGPSGSGGPAPALGGLGLGMSEARTGFLAPFASALASGQKRMSRSRGLPALIAPPAADASAYPGSPTPSSAGSPDVNTRLIGGGLAAAAVAGGAAKNGNGSPTSPQSPFSPQSASSDSPTTERSFYRVSGRKLPSVLQHGGDGYDDPRQSVMSTNTINTSYTANTGHMSMYRDSRGFFGGAGGPATTPASRYALGTPMRPESGVPVFHNGPGKLVSPMRAPMSRQGSFIDDGASAAGSTRNLTPPAAPSSGAAAGYFDPVGRSLISQDGSRGSRGSVSRFTEDIL